MPEAGQGNAPAGLDARYEDLRHAALHERAHAFPRGLGILIARGVTAWRRALTHLTTTDLPSPTASPPAGRSAAGPDTVPPQVSTQLVHALAGLAVALAGT